MAIESLDESDRKAWESFQADVIDRRNFLMVERMQDRLQEGAAFVAVGALHLPGEKGVLKLLQGQGIPHLPPLLISAHQHQHQFLIAALHSALLTERSFQRIIAGLRGGFGFPGCFFVDVLSQSCCQKEDSRERSTLADLCPR